MLIVGAIAFGLAALLNSQTLLDMANRQPFNSATRDIALAITKPLHSIAGAFQLTRPGEAIADVRGGREGGTRQFAFNDDHDDGGRARRRRSDGGGEATGDTTPGATTPPDSVPASTAARVPTKDDKLRLYIAGDSQAQGFGESLERLAGKHRRGHARRSTSRCRRGSPGPTSSTGPSACRTRCARSARTSWWSTSAATTPSRSRPTTASSTT